VGEVDVAWAEADGGYAGLEGEGRAVVPVVEPAQPRAADCVDGGEAGLHDRVGGGDLSWGDAAQAPVDAWLVGLEPRIGLCRAVDHDGLQSSLITTNFATKPPLPAN